MSPTPLRVPARPAARDAALDGQGAVATAVGQAAAIDGLLRELGAAIQRGSRALAREGSGQLATGIARIDALLGGGFPTGRLSEITGPASSGRTSLARALLAGATRRGEWVAWVDGAGAFDAESATSAGVVLERTLWVRPPAPREAVRCCECLLDARGFALVVLDLALPGCAAARDARLPGCAAARDARLPGCAAARDARLPGSTWQRLARRTAGSGTALLVLSHARTTGSFSDLVLEMQPGRAHFSAAPCVGAPVLLEGLSIEARVARHRSGPAQRVAGVVLPVASHAA